ncbi:MAG TPA: CooT family nickel-binding protein [Dehalococcoidia bacterium]|nr:CooT family nickel-binding protein [Dehalococcoidia bacterium]
MSKVYINEDVKKEPLMQEVISLEATDDGRLLLKTIFGQQREIRAEIKKIDFQNGSILLKNMQ